MIQTRLFCTTFLVSLFLGWISPLLAQPTGELFESDEVLEMTLTADFVAFLGDRGMKAKSQKATLTYTDLAGNSATAELKIKVRGHYRRDPMICYFPPLRLNFDKDDDLPAPFTGQDKLKVVTHCQEEEFIFREYYIYKAFNMLTDQSFKVRLAKITYVDVNDARPEETSYAFIIESEEELAARFGGEPVDDGLTLGANDVERTQLSRVHMFNYMIANRDFDIQVRQNVKVVQPSDGLPLVIPYDFDWSGMVNASYTKLNTQPGPVYLDRRRFKKLCRERTELDMTLTEFLDIRERIWNMYESSPYLTQEQIKESLGYYKIFFRTAYKAKTMKKVFMTCE